MRFNKEYHEYLKGNCKNYNQSLVCALEEMEKEGKNMPKYDDDQCVQCGGIRVAGSTLCAACLFSECEIRLDEIYRLEKVKKELEEKNQKLHELCNRLLDHITEDMIYSSNLWSQAGKGKYYSKKGN